MSRRRVTASIALLVVGAVLFEVPGAWLFARGAPWWAALAAALVVFPVGVVTWQLLGERKRKRRVAAVAAAAKPGLKPKASTLTGGDRFVMRLVAVAVIALGPLLFLRGDQAWRAVKDHPLWFVPRGPAAALSFHGDQRLMNQVPADAAIVIWGRRLDALTKGDDGKGRDQVREVLVAFRAGGDAVIALRGPAKALDEVKLDELNDKITAMGGQPWLPVRGKVVSRRRASDLLIVVTEGWATAVDDRDAGRTAGPAAIEARLALAPDDAVVITAAAPPAPGSGLTLTAMQSWLRFDRKLIRIDADFFVPDRAAATTLVERMAAEQRELVALVPADCKPRIEALLREIVIAGGDTMVKLSVQWQPAQVGEAFRCGVGAMMKGADWK